MTETETPRSWRRRAIHLGIVAVFAVLTVGVLLLLMNIRQRKEEAEQHFVTLVGLTEDSTDATVWAQNFPRQYDGYKRTVDTERTKHGGSEAIDKLTKNRRLIDSQAGQRRCHGRLPQGLRHGLERRSQARRASGVLHRLP